MRSIDVFVDEYGGAHLATEKEGVTTYFIVTAILIAENLDVVRAQAEQIRRAILPEWGDEVLQRRRE